MAFVIQIFLLVLVCTMAFAGVWWLRGRGFDELRPTRPRTPASIAGRSSLDISADLSEDG